MANWKKFLFRDKRYKKVEEYLMQLPGPSPWALRANSPIWEGYKWESVEKVKGADGNTLLLNKEGRAVLVLGFMNYVMKLVDFEILIWRQGEERGANSSPVKFIVLDLNKIRPIVRDLKDVYQSEAFKTGGIYFEGPSEIQFEVSTLVVNEDIDSQFPDKLKPLGELFVLCDSTGIHEFHWGGGNRGLMLLNLSENKFHIYPLEWFNKGSFDFGYQWITKIGREPETGAIVGAGVRIGEFVLKPDFSGIKQVL